MRVITENEEMINMVSFRIAIQNKSNNKFSFPDVTKCNK